MSKVFVVQFPMRFDSGAGKFVDKYDISPAAEFGEIVEVIPHGSITEDNVEWAKNLTLDAMSQYRDGDYLLPMGDPLAIMMVGAFASEYCSKLSVLKWDRKTRKYYVVEFEVG